MRLNVLQPGQVINEAVHAGKIATRVAIIGHVVPNPVALSVPSDPRKRSSLLKLYNYTRVITEQGLLVDHVAHLKDLMRGRQTDARSVWEMYLCASLLLKSHLARNGVETLLINYIDSENERDVLGRIRDFDPAIVALSTTFFLTSEHLVRVGKMLREALPKAFIVAGGHHVFTKLMYLNEMESAEYLRASQLDAFINDVQGETTLLALARAWPDRLAEVPNLIWRVRDQGISTNTRVVEDNDVNSTPIDFSGIERGAVVHVRTARSCSFKCSFCSYPTIAGDLALMDVENAVATVRRAKEAGVGALFFIDDTFNVPKPRFERLLDRLIEEELTVPWYSFLRCQYINERLVEKMRRSGCAGVFLGIESGSDKVLKNMNKGSASRYYAPGIRWLKNHDIVTVGAFIIGFPGETTETIAETKEFLERSQLDFYFLQPFYYLHHTPVHKVADQFKLVGSGLFWSHATMDSRRAVEELDRLFLDIKNPVFVNPDYNLWEIAYLRSKGMNLAAIRSYRSVINSMTVSQMRNATQFTISSPPSA